MILIAIHAINIAPGGFKLPQYNYNLIYTPFNTSNYCSKYFNLVLNLSIFISFYTQ